MGSGLRRSAPSCVVLRVRAKVDVAVVLEPQLARHEVVLATPPHGVAIVAQHLEDVGLAKNRVEHVVHRPMAADVRVPTGHERAATRGTHGRLDECAAERHRVGGGQAIEVRRLHSGVADVPQGVAAPLVRVEDDDVRSVGHVDPGLACRDCAYLKLRAPDMPAVSTRDAANHAVRTCTHAVCALPLDAPRGRLGLRFENCTPTWTGCMSGSIARSADRARRHSVVTD